MTSRGNAGGNTNLEFTISGRLHGRDVSVTWLPPTAERSCRLVGDRVLVFAVEQLVARNAAVDATPTGPTFTPLSTRRTSRS